MKFNFKIIAVIFAIFGALIFINTNYFKKEKKSSGLKTESVSVKKDSLILKGVNFYNSKKGTVAWRLKASKAKIDKSKNVAFLDNVSFYFIEKGIVLHSLKGVYNLKSKDATAFKNVEIIGSSWKIITDNVTFSNSLGVITTNTPFKMFGENFYLQGKKLTGLIEQKKFKIKGRVKSKWGEK